MRSAAALSHGGAFAFAGCRGAVLRPCRLPRRHAVRPRRDARKGVAHGRGQRRTRPWTTLHTAMGNVAHGHGQRAGREGKMRKWEFFLFLKTGCLRVAYRSTKKGDLSNIFSPLISALRGHVQGYSPISRRSRQWRGGCGSGRTSAGRRPGCIACKTADFGGLAHSTRQVSGTKKPMQGGVERGLTGLAWDGV